MIRQIKKQADCEFKTPETLQSLIAQTQNAMTCRPQNILQFIYS